MTRILGEAFKANDSRIVLVQAIKKQVAYDLVKDFADGESIRVKAVSIPKNCDLDTFKQCLSGVKGEEIVFISGFDNIKAPDCQEKIINAIKELSQRWKNMTDFEKQILTRNTRSMTF